MAARSYLETLAEQFAQTASLSDTAALETVQRPLSPTAAASPVAADQTAANQALAGQKPAGQTAANPVAAELLSCRRGCKQQCFEPVASVTAPDAAEETVFNFEAIQRVATRYQDGALSSREFIDLLGVKAWGEETDSWGEKTDYRALYVYRPVRAKFRAFCALKAARLDPAAVIGWGSSAEAIPAPVPLPEALARIACELAEEIQEYAREIGGKLNAEALAAVELLAEATCLDPAFKFMEKQAWDLWKAAACAAHAVFGTDAFNLEKNGENSDSDSDGDENASDTPRPLVRDMSSMAAFRCYALVQAGYIQDPDEAFGNFST